MGALTPVFEDKRTTSVSWTPVTGAASYDVLRNGVPVGSTSDVILYERPPVGLLGTYLDYRVVARDAMGNICAVGYGKMRFGKRQI
jgi:hypothetical protein